MVHIVYQISHTCAHTLKRCLVTGIPELIQIFKYEYMPAKIPQAMHA